MAAGIDNLEENRCEELVDEKERLLEVIERIVSESGKIC